MSVEINLDETLLEKISFYVEEDSYVIACFTSKVEVGFFYYNSDTKKAEFSFEIKKEDWNHILQLHIFNNKKEYRVVKRNHMTRMESKEKVIYRGLSLLKTEEEKKEYIDQELMLIPKRWEFKNTPYVFLKVRNYISYNENGMVQMDDYRLVSLVDESGKEMNRNGETKQ